MGIQVWRCTARPSCVIVSINLVLWWHCCWWVVLAIGAVSTELDFYHQTKPFMFRFCTGISAQSWKKKLDRIWSIQINRRLLIRLFKQARFKNTSASCTNTWDCLVEANMIWFGIFWTRNYPTRADIIKQTEVSHHDYPRVVSNFDIISD